MEITQIKDVLNRSVIVEPSRKSLKGLGQSEEFQTHENRPVEEISGRQSKKVEELTENLNRFIQSINYNLQFIPDRESGIVIIKVLDKEGNLIRQIPPEAFLALSSKIGEHIGVLINSKL